MGTWMRTALGKLTPLEPSASDADQLPQQGSISRVLLFWSLLSWSSPAGAAVRELPSLHVSSPTGHSQVRNLWGSWFTSYESPQE